MDHLDRSRRGLLIGTLALSACSPVKGPPVGVSHDRAEPAFEMRDAATVAPALRGLPRDFRTRWTRVAARVLSEHGGMTADVYAHAGSFAEELSAGDAGVGVYLLETSDAGARFGVADVSGRSVADSAGDRGPSLAPCARCHAQAPGGVFPP